MLEKENLDIQKESESMERHVLGTRVSSLGSSSDTIVVDEPMHSTEPGEDPFGPQSAFKTSDTDISANQNCIVECRSSLSITSIGLLYFLGRFAIGYAIGLD